MLLRGGSALFVSGAFDGMCRDLKSGNLLLDAQWRIKISDFGLARIRETSHAHTQVGTFAWMAPEVLESKPYAEPADVYSFAIVMWECLTRREPFKGMHPMQSAFERLPPALLSQGWNHELTKSPS